MVLWIFEITFIYQNIFQKKISLWRKADFAPRNHGAMQTLYRKITDPLSLPREITETLFFAPRNYGAIPTLPRKIIRHSFRGQQISLNLNNLS